MLARLLKAFIGDDRGATAIEYGLLGALIAVALLTSFTLLGNSVVNLMSEGTGSAAQVMAEQAARID